MDADKNRDEDEDDRAGTGDGPGTGSTPEAGSDTAPELAPHEVAQLRGGARAAVVVAVVALHLRGTVKAGRGGTLRTSAASRGHGEHPAPFERAVHTALYRPSGMRELMERPTVRRATAALRAELREAGLLRALPPRRTRAARGILRSLRRAHPLPVEGDGARLPADVVLMSVALYGDRALRLLLPRFTAEGGLTGRGGRADRDLPTSSGGGGGITDGGMSF
jgi:hypothetical protein